MHHLPAPAALLHAIGELEQLAPRDGDVQVRAPDGLRLSRPLRDAEGLMDPVDPRSIPRQGLG
jgi:hypothetical protein